MTYLGQGVLSILPTDFEESWCSKLNQQGPQRKWTEWMRLTKVGDELEIDYGSKIDDWKFSQITRQFNSRKKLSSTISRVFEHYISSYLYTNCSTVTVALNVILE